MFKVPVDKILDKSIRSSMPRIWSENLYIWEKSCSSIDGTEYSFTSNKNRISIIISWDLLLNDFNFSELVLLKTSRVETSVRISIYGRAYVESCCLTVEPYSWDSLTISTMVSTSREMDDVTPSADGALWKDFEWYVPCWSKRWNHFYQMVLLQIRSYRKKFLNDTNFNDHTFIQGRTLFPPCKHRSRCVAHVAIALRWSANVLLVFPYKGNTIPRHIANLLSSLPFLVKIWNSHLDIKTILIQISIIAYLHWYWMNFPRKIVKQRQSMSTMIMYAYCSNFFFSLMLISWWTLLFGSFENYVITIAKCPSIYALVVLQTKLFLVSQKVGEYLQTTKGSSYYVI